MEGPCSDGRDVKQPEAYAVAPCHTIAVREGLTAVVRKEGKYLGIVPDYKSRYGVGGSQFCVSVFHEPVLAAPGATGEGRPIRQIGIAPAGEGYVDSRVGIAHFFVGKPVIVVPGNGTGAAFVVAELHVFEVELNPPLLEICVEGS